MGRHTRSRFAHQAIGACCGPVVQRIERWFPEPQIGVRFPAGLGSGFYIVAPRMDTAQPLSEAWGFSLHHPEDTPLRRQHPERSSPAGQQKASESAS